MNTSSLSAVRMICLATLTLVSNRSATAQEAPEKIPPPGISSRPCAGVPNLRSCLEVHATPLEIRESLRSFGREQKWKMAQEASSADSWTFTRYLEKEELSQVAKTDASGGHINWVEGKAFVVVKNGDAGEGFTRVEISARFQGRGQTTLPFARPTDWWPLASKGTLESGMISALESRFKSPR